MDWNSEWKKTRDENGHSNSVDFWNAFAPGFRKKPEPGKRDIYAEEFYRLSEIEQGDTIFDMGCASGTLAIPFAQKGHEIYAADFSPRMLEVLSEDAAELGLSDRIHTMQLDWNEDWSKRDIPVCDIAISSRSLISDDLEGCLMKLEQAAAKKVCLGVWTSGKFGYDRKIARAIGYRSSDCGAFAYIMNILFEMNRMPRLSYIEGSFKPKKYESFEDCIGKMAAGFPEELDGQQYDRLTEYTKEHLVNKDGVWSYDHDGTAVWAFICWDVQGCLQER